MHSAHKFWRFAPVAAAQVLFHLGSNALHPAPAGRNRHPDAPVFAAVTAFHLGRG